MKIRLCYASTRNESSTDLIEDLNSILSVARDFNEKNTIFGVLYYANNQFFQCLEGDKAIVLELFDRIKLDLRHYNIIEFEVVDIDQAIFKNWSMKYVQKGSKIELFFNNLGLEVFTPSALNEDNLIILLNELASEKQTRIRRKVGLNQRGVTSYL
ncbi:BLUF domain-containing protein [Acinetobacter johnsonii]|uniref:BLUF domain-containing protein n=1 Tax=Acinetobacter johnsonii TaxID=40214 RepID=UPI0013309E49|nr:BLUF domain-containing protein [Acinetobacter johnsonii]